ncbi:thioredoxin-like protein CXXS1 [Morus notabilis]|uniref:thioredoxin-like protein CXXS1 n=1 Tax=Morus notabilis TaxID=981085 RepID=UPI000CED05DB|nr:thioredoxin-like protein CXXS1 [Morus notabilis]
MEGQQQQEVQQSKARVVKVDSLESWDLSITQANNQGSPARFIYFFIFSEFLHFFLADLLGHLFSEIVVHFTASWCMPSVAMNPIFEELASNYPDVLFLVVDVDELKEVASRMDIKAMPTFLLMRNGAQVDKLVGANPEEIKKRIHSFVQSIRIEVA